jgi:hypothetical protein
VATTCSVSCAHAGIGAILGAGGHFLVDRSLRSVLFGVGVVPALALSLAEGHLQDLCERRGPFRVNKLVVAQILTLQESSKLADK